ncbi:MAG: UvrD-helicase domain-containing protein [Candidatus Brocadiia bacterium]|nr:UvrD-helicase domain-containing protein [Candidatus Brocadiia bacterium]
MHTSQSDPITGDLTDAQRRAVCHGEGPLLVVAGAGTGKTRVITRRIAHLAHQGTSPDRILALTFTNKAANEMRRRVEDMVGREVLVTTFHTFCARLLRRDAARLGRDSSFTIYNRSDSTRVVRQILKQMNVDAETFRPTAMLDGISAHKDRMESAEQCAAEALGVEEKALAEVYRLYEARLLDNNALDFDDLLVKTIELFSSHPEVLQRWQNRCVHVLVDEYQDTNLPQHLIARALQGKHRNITAVGDPDQMIYSWRGARLENIMEFEQDFPGASVVMLERNYRSTGHILHAASRCISCNRLRHDKALYTETVLGEPVRVMEFENAREESDRIAATTAELIEGGTSPREIAVLYRTKYLSLGPEDAFSSRALPYQVVDTVGFFDRKQVKDLLAYMQLVVNARDDEAFRRIVNVPARGIGQTTVAALGAAAMAGGEPMLKTARSAAGIAGLGPRAKKSLGRFCELYDRLAGLAGGSIHALLKELLRQTGYVDSVRPEERADVAEVIDYFLGYAKDYDERSGGSGLLGFVEQAALVSDQDGWNATAGTVTLMTLHSAKGLEFDVVFICGVEEGSLPHQRALNENPYRDENYALEEERRLLHVGMTRARRKLYLTFARRRTVRGLQQQCGPSRFLDELPGDGVERHASAAVRDVGRAAAGFATEAARLVRVKKTPLRAVDSEEGGQLAVGAEVAHKTYGEGKIVGIESAGKHHLLRVKFPEHGVLSLLLTADQMPSKTGGGDFGA